MANLPINYVFGATITMQLLIFQYTTRYRRKHYIFLVPLVEYSLPILVLKF